MTATVWHVAGTYFEACNCEAICPCRSVHGRPGGPSTYGVCYGALSWQIQHGHHGDLDLVGRSVVLTIWYADNVQPSTPWQVVLYVDQGADEAQSRALADIFLGRVGGTVASQYGPAIGEVHAVRRLGSLSSTAHRANASTSWDTSRWRPKVRPRSRGTCGVGSRASTTPAPSLRRCPPINGPGDDVGGGRPQQGFLHDRLRLPIRYLTRAEAPPARCA